MSSQVQAEIYKTQQEINRLKQADEINQAQAAASWSMGDYGQGNFVEGLQNSPLSKQISELNDYMTSLVNIQNANYDENQKLQALNQIKQNYSYRKVDYYDGGRVIRRKKRSVKRKSRKIRHTKKNEKIKEKEHTEKEIKVYRCCC
jgi:hypothetical protein